jgi:hypothetical protein
MTLHNRSAQALIWTALIAALALPAAAQSTTPTCVGGAVNPTVRAEGYTELAGDGTITCVGGTATAPGNAVPAVNITVSMNTIITSKITSPAFTPSYNEALLLIDEPGLSNFYLGDPSGSYVSNPINNCGSANAPFDTDPSEGICTIKNDANGGGVSIYNGSVGHPNVFQGRQVPGSQNQIIQFIGIPLDGGYHTIRIANLRASAAFLSGGRISKNGVNQGQGVTFQLFVTITFPDSTTQTINATNGRIQNGLDSVTSTPAGPYLQCAFTAPGSVSAGSITLTEGYPGAWAVRNWRQINDNGTFNGLADWQYNGTNFYSLTDMVQNVPEASYFFFHTTESGFMYPPSNVADLPPINPPPGTSNATTTPSGNSPFSSGVGDPTGISTAGTVSNGTRFAIKFANIPAGVTVRVPGQVNLIDTSGGTGTTGVMLTVGSTDANGAGGTVGAGNLTSSGATFTVIYEVIFEDPFAIESATIPVTANVTAANPQTNVTATAQVGFAPWYDNTLGSTVGTPLSLGTSLTSTAGPLPRFINSFSAPVNLFNFTPCTQLSGLITAKTGPANARVWTATITNIGSSPAAASQITSLTLLQSFGPACTPVISTPFPVTVGDLAPAASGSAAVTIDFSGCNALARFTITLSYSSDAGAVTGSKMLFNQFR